MKHKLKSKSSLKNILLLLFIFVFGFSLKAQNSIDQIMERTDLKIDSVEYLANQYFNKVGTGKGTGYKQYQRWLYERKFHIDNKGYYIAPAVEEKIIKVLQAHKKNTRLGQ
jgi:hypothetical protein